MRACLRCFLFFAQVTIVAFAADPYIVDFAKFNCTQDRAMEGCDTTGQSTNLSDVRIYLYTERSRDKPEPLHMCGGKLPNNTYFNRNKKTRIIIPGYLSFFCALAYPREMMYQFICRDGSNVIIFDWMHAVGERVDYYKAHELAPAMGDKMAFVLKNIMDQANVSSDSFHIVGHSLGAHIAGCTGFRFLNISGASIGRITGLDPAGPGYQNETLEKMLDKGDAIEVDVIHTDYGPCLPALGHCRPLGHADFYVEKKNTMKSCLLQPLISFLKGDIFMAAASLSPSICMHMLAVEIFKASINPCGCLITGVKCVNESNSRRITCNPCGPDGSEYAIMGLDWENDPKPGIYRVETAICCPFCVNNTGVDTSGFPKNVSDGSSSKCCPSKNTYC